MNDCNLDLLTLISEMKILRGEETCYQENVFCHHNPNHSRMLQELSAAFAHLSLVFDYTNNKHQHLIDKVLLAVKKQNQKCC